MSEKEDSSSGSIKARWKELKLQILERLYNPLTGSLVTSWLIRNYRLPTVLFSIMSIENHFIDKTLYLNSWAPWSHELLGRLGCALLYICISPFPSRWISGFWLRRQNGAKKQRDEIDGASLLTREEMDRERKRAYQRILETEEENRILREKLEATEQALREAEALQPQHTTKANVTSPETGTRKGVDEARTFTGSIAPICNSLAACRDK